MSEPSEIKLTIDGEEHVYTGDPDKNLLRFLRDDVGITTPKDGCSPQAACGCCMVEIDGKPKESKPVS